MFLWAGGRRDRILFKNPSGLILKPEEVPVDVDEVWYADCCPTDLTDPAAGRRFLVFDHHLSNARKFEGDHRCTFDMQRSGTSLMAFVLGIHDDPQSLYSTTDDLIEALEAYDLGRFDHAPGQRLADLAACYEQEPLLDLLSPLDPEEILYNRDFTAKADALSAVRTIYAKSAARSARVIKDFSPPGWEHPGTVTAAIAVAPAHWRNAVAEELMNAGAELAIIIDIVGGMVSLRSRSLDVSTMAVAMGGGGHPGAAGFKANQWDMMRSLTEEVFG